MERERERVSERQSDRERERQRERERERAAHSPHFPFSFWFNSTNNVTRFVSN